jgi:hypothetical protein
MDWIDLVQDEGQAAVPCGSGNELSVTIKGLGFLDWLRAR